MRIDELGQTISNDLPFDVVDDAHVFMRNDPVFYRKYYYPTMSKMADCHRAGKKYNPRKFLEPMIDKGCGAYCKKYNIAKPEFKIFTPQDRTALLDKIYSEELQQIEKGDYK